QWFVKIKPLAEPAIKAVEDGRIRIVPESWKNNYLGWMREIKDWCVSRQIWWGHQIPAWYCRKCHDDELTATVPDEKWRPPPNVYPLVGKTKPTECPMCKNQDLLQDPDVLDTWFSSALWPFSTLGWPEKTPELKTFYPTSVLVTGLDILFFWVARMIMLGLKFMGEVPFRDVYIHALVRDAEGQKMSKSKGNVMDPLYVMDQFGTDALRFTLASMASPGRDVKLAEERIEGYRNFANKIWNAARFVLMNLDGAREFIEPRDRSFPDRWILDCLNITILKVNGALERYRFDEASSELYQFIWHEYCDWYLEMIKPALQDRNSIEAKWIRQTLLESFETMLRLLHPFMPFITEEIWQALPHEGESLVQQHYPDQARPKWESKASAEAFQVLEQFVTLARAERAVLNYPPGKNVTLYGFSEDHKQLSGLENLSLYLQHLCKGTIRFSAPNAWPVEVLRLPEESLTVGLLVEGDVDLQKALQRISKQYEERSLECSRVAQKLSNSEFIHKAPRHVVFELYNREDMIKHELKRLESSEQQIRQIMLSRDP
ncbi:MAG: class I tRNA ligase family protein, partial [Nitrospiraceae bacterium]